MTPSEQLLIEHQKNQEDPHRIEDFFSVYAVLSKPWNIGFNIHSFGAQERDTDEWKLWQRGAGVDGFISFESNGYTSHPKAFETKPVNLLVNALSSIDRFGLAEKGSIGDGWYDGREFLLRLHLDLPLTRQLLELLHNPIALGTANPNPLVALGQDVTGHDPSGLNVRFDLFKLKYWEKPQQTGYEIVRIYINL